MVVAAGRTGKRAVTGTYSAYESCWLQISRRKLKGPRRVDKPKKTAIELEEIVKQRIGAGDFRVTVHRNPDSGWHARFTDASQLRSIAARSWPTR